jgi:hypothetical protein
MIRNFFYLFVIVIWYSMVQWTSLIIYIVISVVDFTKSCKSKISRKCEFQPIKSLEITLTITLTINLRLTTFCEIDPCFLNHNSSIHSCCTDSLLMTHRGGLSLSIIMWRIERGGPSFLLPWGPKIRTRFSLSLQHLYLKRHRVKTISAEHFTQIGFRGIGKKFTKRNPRSPFYPLAFRCHCHILQHAN